MLRYENAFIIGFNIMFLICILKYIYKSVSYFYEIAFKER